MSEFAADWLALRESADRRARNSEILAAVTADLAARPTLTIVDLGCGTGSNLRALAAHLPAVQRWRLVDDDPALLAAARLALIDWADGGRDDGDRLCLETSGRQIEITFERADLAKNLADVLARPADLVTAAAFFDLVSSPWIASFCQALAEHALPLYAVLTYDGTEQWTPPQEADKAMLEAFHAHQSRDKGFGPAAGPAAAALLEARFQQQGYQVASGASPWRLGRDDEDLIAALAEGAAAAVAETGRVPEADRRAWRRARAAASTCTIGHIDLFARPSRKTG